MGDVSLYTFVLIIIILHIIIITSCSQTVNKVLTFCFFVSFYLIIICFFLTAFGFREERRFWEKQTRDDSGNPARPGLRDNFIGTPASMYC
jgi:hypothetical protein